MSTATIPPPLPFLGPIRNCFSQASLLEKGLLRQKNWFCFFKPWNLKHAYFVPFRAPRKFKTQTKTHVLYRT